MVSGFQINLLIQSLQECNATWLCSKLTYPGVTLVQFYCNLCLTLTVTEPESNLLTDI